jgi:hypothetical protein
MMAKRKVKPERDLEKAYSKKEFVDKLRRLADLEKLGIEVIY